MESKVRIVEVANHGDSRGYSFTMPAEALAFVGDVQDVHFSSMVPGSVRGNHFHLRKREAIVVFSETPWSFHWDEGEGSQSAHAEFTDSGARLILVTPGASHAVRNHGGKALTLVAFTSEPFDPAETVARKVV